MIGKDLTRTFTRSDLFGYRFSDFPLRRLTLPELAHLYAYSVCEHGENSPQAIEIIKEVEQRANN